MPCVIGRALLMRFVDQIADAIWPMVHVPRYSGQTLPVEYVAVYNDNQY